MNKCLFDENGNVTKDKTELECLTKEEHRDLHFRGVVGLNSQYSEHKNCPYDRHPKDRENEIGIVESIKGKLEKYESGDLTGLTKEEHKWLHSKK